MYDIRVSYWYQPAPSFPTTIHPAYHSHPFDEMLIIRSGDVIAMTANTYLSHKGSCVLFYKKFCPHTQINGGGIPYERYCINFDRNAVAEFSLDASLLPPAFCEEAVLLPLNADEEERLTAAAKLLYRCPSQEGGDIRRRLLLSYLLAEVLEISNRYAGPQPIHYYLTSVTQYISNHIQEKLTIDRIAKEFHIGRTKLIRDFRDFFSMGICQYITMERLVRARMLLQHGGSVLTAAEQCGFTDSAYFIRVFRKYYGITPAMYHTRSRVSTVSETDLAEKEDNGTA